MMRAVPFYMTLPTATSPHRRDYFESLMTLRGIKNMQNFSNPYNSDANAIYGLKTLTAKV